MGTKAENRNSTPQSRNIVLATLIRQLYNP
jgi:hypothetical protein